MSKVREIPDCFGTYEEEHPTCDGEDDEQPCPIRGQCQTLLARCEESGEDPEVIVSKHGLAILDILDEEGEAEEEVPPEPQKRPQASRAPAPPPDKGPADFAPTSEMWGLYGWFSGRLLDALGREMAEPDQVPIPGQVYDRDHVAASRYMRLYVKAGDGGPDTPLAHVRFRPRYKRLDVRFPVDNRTAIKAAGKRNAKKLLIRSVDSGKFRSEARGLDKEKAAIAAELIGRLAKAGAIEGL